MVIFGITVPSYVFFLVLSGIVYIVIGICRGKKFGFSIISAAVMSLVNAWGILCGAKLLFWMNYTESLTHGIPLFGGFLLFGSVFFLPVYMYMVRFFVKMGAKNYFNFSTPGLVATASIFKVGCLMAGCCYGVEANWGVAMQHSPEVLRIPLQIIELVLLAIFFVIVLLIEKRSELVREKGLLYPVFMIGYGCIRFVLEFLREKENVIWILSQEHFLSILAIAIGIIWIYFKTKKQKQQG